MMNVCIVIKSLEIGGTEKALINMLNEMNPNIYKVDLFLLEDKRYLEVPQWVNVRVIENYMKFREFIMRPPLEVIKNLFRNKKLKVGMQLIIRHILFKLTRNRDYYYSYICKEMDSIFIEYDVAIAYSGPFDFMSSLVLKKIKAEKKIQWIHFDVSKIYFDIHYAKKYYPKFDEIITVSKSSADQLVHLIPIIENKIKVIPNFLNKSYCYKKSLENIPYMNEKNIFKILTVGRLSSEKGQLIIPNIVESLLKNEFYNFKWFIVGDGADYKKLNRIIKDKKLDQYIQLCGVQENPYPYFAQCDLYVQTSLHEGFCITVAEALLFKKYIISTNITGIKDQITNSDKGVLLNYDGNEFSQQILNYFRGEI